MNSRFCTYTHFPVYSQSRTMVSVPRKQWLKTDFKKEAFYRLEVETTRSLTRFFFLTCYLEVNIELMQIFI